MKQPKATVYPVAEIFESIQGEGMWAGVPMWFVRLAGCNVGKPFAQEEREALGLQIYQEKCTSWTGATFPCDTNYRVSERLTTDEILERIHTPRHGRVSITGGEPFIHPLGDLVSGLSHNGGYHVHIETSGTHLMPVSVLDDIDWMVCSPKMGCSANALLQADEIRILVGPMFDEQTFVRNYLTPYGTKVWLSPVNDENTLAADNCKRAMELALKYNCRLSLQIHKVLGAR